MYLTRLAFVTSIPLVSQAFLLPPEISSADVDVIKAPPFEWIDRTEDHVLNLKCAGCPVATTDGSGNTLWLQGIESTLELRFSVSADDVDVLSLNNVQLYPPRGLSSLGALIAPQISSEGRKDLRLGYELSIKPITGHVVEQSELISVDFQIVEIDGQFVNGLDSVALKLLKTTDGYLFVGQLETAPTTNPIINPTDDINECTTLICKWRAIVAGKVSRVKSPKGCSKSNPDHLKTWHHKSHGPHHRHHRYHGAFRFLFALKSVAIHVLIPVFIGIAVGMVASLLGMVVGNIVVFVWRALYRRGQKGTYSKVQQEETVITHPKVDLQPFDQQHTPPVYDDYLTEKVEGQ